MAHRVHGVTEPDGWKPFRYFVGSWRGRESGRAGIGEGERTYEFVLGGKFLFQRNRSVFAPQEKNPKGEVHEDFALFSYDTARKTFVLREFHSEGFVNQYVLATSDGGTFVFASETFENVPPGWRARLTLRAVDEDHVHETFELAPAGKDLATYIENRWARIQ